MDALSIRYNIQHVGDIVIDLLEKPVLLGRSFASGVALTYDIRELNHKKLEILKELGERVAQITATDPAALSTDEALRALTARLMV